MCNAEELKDNIYSTIGTMPSTSGIKLVISSAIINDNTPRYRIIKSYNIIICNKYFYDNIDVILEAMNKHCRD